MQNIIDEIKKLSEYTNDGNQAIYNLGCIHGLILGYDNILYSKHDIPAERKQQIKEIMDDDKPVVKSFADAAVEELEKRGLASNKSCTDDNTDRIEALMDRVGERRNLNFEISKRWPNKSYAKTITGLLNQYGISTMDDFLKTFDDYRNYSYLRYTVHPSNGFGCKFPFKEINDDDRKKFYMMYDAMNEHMDGKRDSEAILKELVNNGPMEKKNCYVSRYTNALLKYGICNIHQLYFWLKQNDVNLLKDINGLGHVAPSIYELKNFTLK